MASGAVGTASMLRARRRDVNVKPNRRLDRKSSRGMLYENEELRLRTININAEVERGQNDIKKLRRENEQLRREIWGLREEYDRLEELLHSAASSRSCQEYATNLHDDEEDLECRRNVVENAQNLQNITCIKFQRSKSCSKVEFDNLGMVYEEVDPSTDRNGEEVNEHTRTELSSKCGNIRNNLESIFPEVEYENTENNTRANISTNSPEIQGEEQACPLSLEIPTMLQVHQNNIWSHSLYTMNSNSYAIHRIHHHPLDVLSETDNLKDRKYVFADPDIEIPCTREFEDSDFKYGSPSPESVDNVPPASHNTNFIHVSYRNKEESIRMTKKGTFVDRNGFQTPRTSIISRQTDSVPGQSKSLFSEGGNLDGLLNEVNENAVAPDFVSGEAVTGEESSSAAPVLLTPGGSEPLCPRAVADETFGVIRSFAPRPQYPERDPSEYSPKEATNSMQLRIKDNHSQEQEFSTSLCLTGPNDNETCSVKQMEDRTVLYPDVAEYSPAQNKSEINEIFGHEDILQSTPLDSVLDITARSRKPVTFKVSSTVDTQQRRLSKSMQNLSAHEGNVLLKKRVSFPPIKPSASFGGYRDNLCYSNDIERMTLQKINLNNEQTITQDVLHSDMIEHKSTLESQKPVTQAPVPPSSEGNLQNCNNLHQSSSNQYKRSNSCESDASVHEHITGGKSVLKQNESHVLVENEINFSPQNISRRNEQNRPSALTSVLHRECKTIKDSIISPGRGNRPREQHEVEKSPPDEMYRYIQAFSKTNRKCSGHGSHFQSLHKMSVILGDTQHGRSLFVDHSLSASSWQNSLSNEHCIKQMSMCSNSQRKYGFCAKKNILVRDTGEKPAGTAIPLASPSSAESHSAAIPEAEALRLGTIMWERTNSYGSMASSVDGRFSVTKTKAPADHGRPKQRPCEENVPWCGCWGNGCL